MHTPDMSGCSQPRINASASTNVRGIRSMHMKSCRQPSMTDATFVNQYRIRSPYMTAATGAY